MIVNKGVLVIMLWIMCELGVSAQLTLPPATIGTACTQDDICTRSINNSVCRDLCACKNDYVAHSNKASCLPVARNINDNCEESLQCTTPFGNIAECSIDKKCVCMPEYHIVSTPKQCIRNRGLGETCSEKSQCYLEEEGPNQNTDCVEDVCRCRSGYKPTPDNRRCEDSAATNIISITCLVGVWILHLGV